MSRSTLTLALNFVEQRPAGAERKEGYGQQRRSTRGRDRICAAEKNLNLSSRQFLKIAKGLGKNETRLCKWLKNVRLTAGDRKKTVSRGLSVTELRRTRRVFAERRRDDRTEQRVVIHNNDSSVRIVNAHLLRQSDTGTWKDLREAKARNTANQAVSQTFKYLYSEKDWVCRVQKKKNRETRRGGWTVMEEKSRW